jgi:hypothetical protein
MPKMTSRYCVHCFDNAEVKLWIGRRYQAFLRNDCEMTYFECPNDVDQALFEIMFWLRFDTQFNEWKTH